MTEKKACLVCRVNCEEESTEDFRDNLQFDGCNGNSALNRQLWNVFIARKLLGFERGTCEELLKGGRGRRNPSSWFWTCGQCSGLLEEAWRVQEQIGRLEEELRGLGKRLKERIGEKEEWTVVEKRILRWIGKKDEETEVKKVTKRKTAAVKRKEVEEAVVVKKEVPSPSREVEEDFHWDGDSLGGGGWTSGGDDGESVLEPLVKIEVDEALGALRRRKEAVKSGGDFSDEDDAGDFKDGGDSDSSFSWSEEDWKPKKRKRVTRAQKLKKEVDYNENSGEEDGNSEEDEEENQKKSAAASRKQRSNNSIRKAKSSLRAKKTDGIPVPRRVRKRQPNQKKPLKIQCSRCSAMFRNEAELAPHTKVHEKSDTLNNEWDCKTCGYPCESERSLRQHMSLKHELQKYICDICGYEAPRKGRLARHKKLHDKMIDSKTYQCDICQETFTNYISFTRHQRQLHAKELNLDLFQCDKCAAAYTTNKMLQDHILHVHEKNSRWCCDICGKGLLSEKNLKEHLETHEIRERTEICWVCGVDFLNHRSLREHIRKFHPSQYQTKYTRGPQKTPEEKEAASQEEDKEYKCLYCSFKSPFRLVVMRHRKTHREVFRHLCEICSNEYSSLASLVLHKKINHGDGKTIVQCEWCNKSFAHKHYLQNHIPRCKLRPKDVPVVKRRKPFRDTLLVKPGGNQEESELKKEPPPPPKEKEEEPPKPPKIPRDPNNIVCKYCHTFTAESRGKMYGHVIKEHKHELEFKFRCELCDTKYVSKTSLNRHRAIHHSNEHVMACIYCQKVFRHWSLLRLHYKNNCKAMPEGVPIPECPNKRAPREPQARKYKEYKKRGTGIRAKKKQKQMMMEGMWMSGGEDTTCSSVEGMGMGAAGGPVPGSSRGGGGGSQSQEPFPLMYAGGGEPVQQQHQQQQGNFGGNVGPSVSASAAAAAAMQQMFGIYGNPGIGGGQHHAHGQGGSGGGGHRGWW